MDYEMDELSEIETEDEVETEVETDDMEQKVGLSPAEVLQLAAEGANIADFIDDHELGEIGAKVCEYYEKDKESRQGWTDAMEGWIDLALQVKEDKSFPWDGASNVKFPLATVAVIQFASRISPAIIRTPYPVTGRVNGYQTPEKMDAAKRVGMHMSYQLTDEMPTWIDDQDTLFHILPITGCAFKKTYRDPKRGNVSELVMPDRLVFDYYAKSVEDARCVTHSYTLHGQEIESNRRFKIFRDVELSEAPSPASDSKFDQRNKVNDTEAIVADKNRQYSILEQHSWLDLDEDGLDEPYIITVEEKSKKVLRIEPRFTADNVYIGADDEVLGIVADSYFTHYTFFPDPSGGNLGLGWGRILGPINESVNTAINQLIDNGTLNNMGGGMFDKNLKIEGGLLYREPGKWHKVDAAGANIAQGVYPWVGSEPSQVLYQLLTLLINWGQRITAVTDTMSGEMPASNVPATTTLAMLEQGQKVFQGIYARIYRALQRELKKLAELNRRYMSDEEYFRVLDGGAATVSKHDYLLDMTDVTLTAEQTLPSEQVAMARFRVMLEAMNAGVSVNPEVMNRYLIQILGMPPESQEQIILPPQPSMVDEAKVMETQAKIQSEQERNQLEGARIAVEDKRIETDARLKIADMRMKSKQDRMSALVNAGKMMNEPTGL